MANPEMPKDTWSVTAEEKNEIREFGRALQKFIFEYAQNKATNGRFHAKIMFGAFQYIADIQSQRAKAIGDDILVGKEVVERYGLNETLVEPFADEPKESPEKDVASPEQKLKQLELELNYLNREIETPEQRKARIESEIAAIKSSIEAGAQGAGTEGTPVQG